MINLTVFMIWPHEPSILKKEGVSSMDGENTYIEVEFSEITKVFLK